MYRRFFDRIAIGYIVAIGVIFIIVILYASNAARQSQIEVKTDAITRIATYTSQKYLIPYHNGELTDDELLEALNNLDDNFNVRIWYADERGNLVFASLPQNTNQSIVYYYLPDNIFDNDSSGALTGIFAMTGDFYNVFPEQMLSVGLPVDGKSSSGAGTVLVHAPFSEVLNITQTMFLNFLVPVLVIIVLSMIGLLFLARRILKPVNQLNYAAKEYAAGNFEARTDITSNDEFGELASNLEFMASELSKLDEYRKSFVANISHDFRSPLTSIKGYIEAMLDGTIPKDNQERYLNIVLSETQRLTKLTSSMLEMNENDTKGLKLNLINFNIMEIIDSTSDIFEGTCKERYIVIRKVCNVDNPMVRADKTRIQQVIYNLVDNAIKFSPHGSTITLSVNALEDKILVSVRDTGQGIAKEQQNKVWDRFYKGDESRGKDKKGSGLGLAIIREIIRAHGEDITMNSTPGKGTEFIFTLKRIDG
ncbi:MAG: HAMP domain-containing histidine kinase [Lachnospiraceae bacterium]|nr:HAMP domain-containing histidine kinase [Lachnospiraceae bacterium]